jgi:DNA-binding response OmpR family regulator
MKKTLLVVDDEPSICLILEHYFHLDFKVVLKSNGLEAIVADYAMPVMDGFDFIKQLRADSSHQYTPIIILSGKDETTSKISFLKQGADDYVVKPFNPEELELRLKRLLVRARL